MSLAVLASLIPLGIDYTGELDFGLWTVSTRSFEDFALCGDTFSLSRSSFVVDGSATELGLIVLIQSRLSSRISVWTFILSSRNH